VYDYTEVQKNIMYQIIGFLQDKMSSEAIQENLLGETEVKIPLKVLDPNRNYKRIIQASKGMINKPIEYSVRADGGKKKDILTTLISTVIHEQGGEDVMMVIPSAAIPVFCFLGDGWTPFRKTLAIGLRSVYAKRMYELCCQWENKGGFQKKLSELRKILVIPDSYKNANIKQRILDKVKEQLKESEDLYYEYTLEKTSRDTKEYDIVRFKIISRKAALSAEKKKLEEGEYYAFLYRFFSSAFDSSISHHIVDGITSKGMLERANRRFGELDDEFTRGKLNKLELVKLSRHILKNDYEITFKGNVVNS